MNRLSIILLASERSGSNLLRVLIGNHKEICAPVSPHLMSEFYDFRKYYGDLRIKENALHILEDMLVTANHPYHGWGLETNLHAITDNANSVVKAMDSLYLEKAKQEGKRYYCSKGINAFKFIDAYRAEIENVRFIHLVRDPRDHVASWMQRAVEFTAYDAALKWKQEQETYLDAVFSRGLESISVRYEDLIADTGTVMTQILNYIGVEVDEKCFETNQKNQEAKRNPYWANLSNPIIKDNAEGYKKNLSNEEVRMIETITKKEMAFFGYKPVSDCSWRPPSDFNAVLNEAREKRKREVAKNKKEHESIQDKWNRIHQIKRMRKEEWEKLNGLNSNEIIPQPSVPSFIKVRIRYLVFAFLGVKTSTRIMKRLKSIFNR